MPDQRKIWPYSDVPADDISIYAGVDVFLEDFAAASRENQPVFAAYWFQAEVLNGGLSQFFSNDTGVLAPEAVAACRTFGLPLLASKLEEAMLWFGSPYPRERAIRESALAAYEVVNHGKTPFENLDDEVTNLIYGEASGLEKAAIGFLEQKSS